MAAKIGILGESTATTTSITTVYTVPSSKAARIRVLWLLEESGGATRSNYLVGSPGTEMTYSTAIAANNDTWTGLSLTATPDPTLALTAGFNGRQEKAAGITNMSTAGQATDYLAAPLPIDYFLSTGDTVRFQYDTAPTDHLFQAHGVEDDA